MAGTLPATNDWGNYNRRVAAVLHFSFMAGLVPAIHAFRLSKSEYCGLTDLARRLLGRS